MLNRQLAVEDAVTVAWWLPEEHHWVLRPSTVNPERRTVTFQTDHLTFWTLIYTLEGYLVSHSAGGHFKTVYDSNGTSTDTSRSYQYWNTDFADIINGDLENAYNIYVATNTFKPPSTPIWVLIDPSTSDPTWAGMTGDIYVPDNFDGLEALRQELAHELFHAVENRYYNVYAAGFGGRIWWHEACADFASQSLVMGRTSPFPSGLTPSFLVQPLTTFNARHEYDVANFLDYVFRHSNGKLDFKTHFTELAVLGYYSTLARLADLVRTKTGKELAAYYGEFAADFLFNERGYRPGLDPWSAPVNVQHQHVFPTNSTKYSQTFELKGGYSAQLLATKVLAAKEPRKLRVSVSPPTGNAFIDIYKLSSLRLDSPPTPEWLVQNGGISIDDGEYLCFVAVNCSPDTASTISVTVEDEPSTTITGTTTYQITQGSPSAFTIEGDWTLTGEIVTSTANHFPPGGVYMAVFTVKTNQPVSFNWNYKLDRNPAELTETYTNGSRVVNYAQPTIDGKTITVSPEGNPSLQQLITDSTVTLDILFTDLSQSVTLILSAQPRYSFITYLDGQIWNQGSDHEGGMGNMYLIFKFMPEGY